MTIKQISTYFSGNHYNPAKSKCNNPAATTYDQPRGWSYVMAAGLFPSQLVAIVLVALVLVALVAVVAII